MKKLPAIWTGKPENALRKVESKDLSFEDKLANLRKATGKPETIEVPMRCSLTGERAIYVYMRMHPQEKYRLAATNKVETGKSRFALFDGLGARKRALKAIDVNEFDSCGRACPWCGNDRFVVDCPECHEATCGATIEVLAGGQERHRCHPDCGHYSMLGPAAYMSGGKPDRRGTLDPPRRKAIGNESIKLRLTDARKPALPGKIPPLLPPPKKR